MLFSILPALALNVITDPQGSEFVAVAKECWLFKADCLLHNNVEVPGNKPRAHLNLAISPREVRGPTKRGSIFGKKDFMLGG